MSMLVSSDALMLTPFCSTHALICQGLASHTLSSSGLSALQNSALRHKAIYSLVKAVTGGGQKHGQLG